MVKNNISVLVLLILSLVGTAIIVLMLANSPNSPNNANNQEFKERALILITETIKYGNTLKMQYKFFQLTEKKIEIEICIFYPQKVICEYQYPDSIKNNFKDAEYIKLLDALEIQPGDTTTINMEDLEDEILDKFGYLLGERKGDGEGDASLPIIY